ncbi:MAG: deoxyribodipyrimidine photo-lyase [Candidatus Neomarinimicrobiota bacterium]|jgi:deoxyribodipyrimidine photo-lyase|nr:deoxyribodipyrimidine photo-lyase [Candidatus Neomarinimicrobiota bacterium]MDD3966105.1 deoxyribodipyrimidine photo-lyase [Candidatus Neomarinimicrobiota bacterium]MDX9780133.1 deoxyribodipyrimidine photo-lyase [bacterium]
MKNSETDIAVFWFRRDLRLEDNTGLNAALRSRLPVLPVFIFDDAILNTLSPDDSRLNFIYRQLKKIHGHLKGQGSGLYCRRGTLMQIWDALLREFPVRAVYTNKDYEAAAIRRDDSIRVLLEKRGIGFYSFKDQVIFEETEIAKSNGMPYTVFTPYMRKWRDTLKAQGVPECMKEEGRFYQYAADFPEASILGFRPGHNAVKPYDLDHIDRYAAERDYPAKDAGSYLGPHLRFGTVSVRQLLSRISPKREVFLSELIWREFFMQILANYPRVEQENFREKYKGIEWRNNKKEFERWCRGETGYPLVDAGMRELNESGYMHNRVRMLTASFLCKHLLIDWRWGERYFAGKLLDYELSSNNGNWQWAAGTGCDAAPYFRIFNPETQQRKFDKDLTYIRKWIPGFKAGHDIPPIVEHAFARERALKVYRQGIIN